MKPPTTYIKKKLLQNILASPSFSESSTFQKLMTYLVESEIREKSPRETTIAQDVLAKGTDHDPAIDASVRVYMHHLRQKLDRYYQKDGKRDKYKLVIPKGHYSLQFVKNKSVYSSVLQKHWIKGLAAIGLFILGWVFHQIVGFSDTDIAYDNNHLIWSDIEKKNVPFILSFGDYFFFLEYKEKFDKTWIVRDRTINSQAEFQSFLKNSMESENQYQNTPFTYTGFNSLECYKEIAPYFQRIKSTIRLKQSSDLSWEDILTHQIYFFGSYKSLGILNHIFSQLHIRYQIQPDKVLVRDNQGQELVYPLDKENEGKYLKDYTVVAKLPGPSGHDIFLFACFKNIGITQAVKQFTIKENYERLKNQLVIQDEPPEYFELLFRVKGLDRMGFKAELLYYRELDKNEIVYEMSEY